MTVHPEYGKSWTGAKKEHCPACHETFSSTRAGDLHRRGEFGKDRHCVDPATVGLTLTEGVWRRPGTYEREA